MQVDSAHFLFDWRAEMKASVGWGGWVSWVGRGGVGMGWADWFSLRGWGSGRMGGFGGWGGMRSEGWRVICRQLSGGTYHCSP